MDTFLRLYVRYGLHVGRGGQRVFLRVTTGIGKVLILGIVIYITGFKAVTHISNFKSSPVSWYQLDFFFFYYLPRISWW